MAQTYDCIGGRFDGEEADFGKFLPPVDGQRIDVRLVESWGYTDDGNFHFGDTFQIYRYDAARNALLHDADTANDSELAKMVHAAVFAKDIVRIDPDPK